MPKRWCLTGGAGFLGAALTRALIARGDKVRVLDDASRSRPETLPNVDCELYLGDVCHAPFVRESVKGCDAVIHLAAINGTRHFYERPGRVLEVATKGIINVMDACLLEGVKEIHAASSSEVYQSAFTVPTPEDVGLIVPDPYNPRYSYGCGKIFTEMMLLHYHTEHFTRVTIVRPHNVYGPGAALGHVIPDLIEKVLATLKNPDKPTPVPIQGFGTERRSFCYIDDAVSGMLTVIDRGEHRGIYNVGVQEEVNTTHLLQLISEAAERWVVPNPDGMHPDGGVIRRCPDVSKLTSLGWQQRVGLRAGLEQTVKWYIDQQAAIQETLPCPAS